jgi:hypothetical protein
MNQPPIFSDLPGDDSTGGRKNLYEINKYVKPELNKLGFECISISGRKDNVQRIFKSVRSNTANFLSQIFYVRNVDEVPVKSRISIPPKIVRSTTIKDRIEVTLFYLGMTHIWLFVSVRNDWYVLIKYADIPPEGWYLSWRKDPKVYDRMNIRSDYLVKMVKPYFELTEDIENILNSKR